MNLESLSPPRTSNLASGTPCSVVTGCEELTSDGLHTSSPSRNSVSFVLLSASFVRGSLYIKTIYVSALQNTTQVGQVVIAARASTKSSGQG